MFYITSLLICWVKLRGKCALRASIIIVFVVSTSDVFKAVVKLSQQLVLGCLFEFSCSFLSCVLLLRESDRVVCAVSGISTYRD